MLPDGAIEVEQDDCAVVRGSKVAAATARTVRRLIACECKEVLELEVWMFSPQRRVRKGRRVCGTASKERQIRRSIEEEEVYERHSRHALEL